MKMFCFRDGRRGQVMVLAPVLFLALGATAALTIDMGHLVVKKAALQNTCDASSLAGAEVILDDQKTGLDWQNTRVDAYQEALTIFQANTRLAAPTIEFGNWDNATSTFTVVTDVTQPAWAVRVTAARDASAPGGQLTMCFGGLLGMPKADVSACAVTQVATGITALYGGLSPFAVPKTAIAAAISGGTNTMTFYPASSSTYTSTGQDTVAPGNWGLLNLDGGSLSEQELVTEIEDHNYEMSIPSGASSITITGCSGFRAGIQAAINQVLDQPMMMAVYSTVTGSGANGQFTIVGFISCKIVSCQLTGNSPEAQCLITGYTPLSGMDATAGNSGYFSPNLRKVQLCE